MVRNCNYLNLIFAVFFAILISQGFAFTDPLDDKQIYAYSVIGCAYVVILDTAVSHGPMWPINYALWFQQHRKPWWSHFLCNFKVLSHLLFFTKMSHSTGSSSTTDRESINRIVTTSVNEIKNIINQDLDYVLLHQELINGFCRHVSILQQQTFRLSTNHLCSLVLLKMLASLFKNDHPAIKSYTDLLAETWDNFDFNNGVLKYVQNELAEKRGKVKKYIEEQHAIDQQIASSEEQNSLLKEKKTKLAEAIRFENEDIVELEKECRDATHRKVGYNNKLKCLEGLIESKMHNFRETWSEVKSSINL
ncbi:hypothetical protein QL285_050345 [Trifolium repens]|nr:hypothetical protein QL285_050345 [Trifolium repens]